MTKREALAAAAAGAIVLLIVALVSLPSWFWHPMGGRGYAFWSGIGSDIGELTIVASLVSLTAIVWKRFSCHADGCQRLAWHEHDGHGHPVCKRHHPDGGNVAHSIGGIGMSGT